MLDAEMPSELKRSLASRAPNDGPIEKREFELGPNPAYTAFYLVRLHCNSGDDPVLDRLCLPNLLIRCRVDTGDSSQDSSSVVQGR